MLECKMKIIDETKINEIIANSTNSSNEVINSIIKKSKELKGLSIEDAGALLSCNDENLLQTLFDTSKQIKNEIYGNRVVIFAPLYISNLCKNNCTYCAFRQENNQIQRVKLSDDEINHEVLCLLYEGHKRLLVVAGESSDIDFVTNSIKTIYDTKADKLSIRRVNVNIAPLSIEDFKKLKESKIGTYQLFQETYHHETYKKVHPSGPKSDYDFRLEAMDRAMDAGIEDVGIGALFGLYDYKFEVLSLIAHAKHLETKYGVGPHTVSVPRIEPAQNAPDANKILHDINDEDFKKIISIIRLALPYTGIILSTRENAKLRDELLSLGVSQISAGSSTSVGGYSKDDDVGQFNINDNRTHQKVIDDMIDNGYMPSFCTACYRTGRTGEDFMDLAKPGEIKKFCLPNCLITFKEYASDFGDEKFKIKASKIIDLELEAMDEKTKIHTQNKLDEIEKGKRDLYF